MGLGNQSMEEQVTISEEGGGEGKEGVRRMSQRGGLLIRRKMGLLETNKELRVN